MKPPCCLGACNDNPIGPLRRGTEKARGGIAEYKEEAIYGSEISLFARRCPLREPTAMIECKESLLEQVDGLLDLGRRSRRQQRQGLGSPSRRSPIQRRNQGQGLKQFLGRGQGNDTERRFLLSAGQKCETYPASGILFAADRKLTKRSVEASRLPGRRAAIGHNDVVDDRKESGGDAEPVGGARLSDPTMSNIRPARLFQGHRKPLSARTFFAFPHGLPLGRRVIPSNATNTLNHA